MLLSVLLATPDLLADAAQEPQHLLTRHMGSQKSAFGGCLSLKTEL